MKYLSHQQRIPREISHQNVNNSRELITVISHQSYLGSLVVGITENIMRTFFFLITKRSLIIMSGICRPSKKVLYALAKVGKVVSQSLNDVLVLASYVHVYSIRKTQSPHHPPPPPPSPRTRTRTHTQRQDTRCPALRIEAE